MNKTISKTLWEQHKLIIIVPFIFVVLNIGIIVHIHNNFEPVINYTENLESPLEYVWNSTDGEVSLGENQAKVTFDGSEDKIYFYMFDSSTTAPIEYYDLAVVPEETDTLQIDVLMQFPIGIVVSAYLQQYDSDGKRLDDVLFIESVNTDTIKVNKSGYATYPYSMKVKKDSRCKTFNVLFDIRPNGESGYFSLSDIDVIMK